MTHFESDSFRAEVWCEVKKEWGLLGGTILKGSPKHGYRFTNDKMQRPAIFVELVGGNVGEQPQRFKRFYILRRYNVEKFKSEIGKVANESAHEGVAKRLWVRRQIKNGKPAGLNCDISDWTDWKATVKIVLTWAWRRRDKNDRDG